MVQNVSKTLVLNIALIKQYIQNNCGSNIFFRFHKQTSYFENCAILGKILKRLLGNVFRLQFSMFFNPSPFYEIQGPWAKAL